MLQLVAGRSTALSVLIGLISPLYVGSAEMGAYSIVDEIVYV